jgi:4-hydroxy-tetrahydrodipicolinate reductase
MGQRVCEAVHGDPNLQLVAAIDRADHPKQGEDIGLVVGLGPVGIAVGRDLPDQVDGAIDFSTPTASLAFAKKCAARQLPLVVATTGFSAKEREQLIEYHHEMPLLVASNCSLVVNLLLKLARIAGEKLRDRDFDVEIVEKHHRFKVDAPSGTALSFADVLQDAMGLTNRRHGREGITGERPRQEIGLHAIRAGDNIGEHAIIFSTLGETMELVHRGHSRDSYARGAVAAIRFLVTKKPGLYTMADVLDL